MNTTRTAFVALIVVLVLAPSALQAQAATAGRRGAVTRSRTIPSPALQFPSVPVATPRRHGGIADHFGKNRGARRLPVYDRRFRSRAFAQQTVFVPWSTTVVQESGPDTELLEAVEAARDAAFEAREAALDAREAALDARAAVEGRASAAPSGSRALTWKPGGITPVDPDGTSTWNRSKVVVLEPGGEPVLRPAADADPPALTRYAAPATAVTFRAAALSPWLVPLPGSAARSLVPWWAATECPTVQQQAQQRQQQDRRRFPWGLGWLARYGRDVEVERGAVAAPSFYYMRSPLLYGLYRRPDCPPGEESEEICAEVTVVGDDDAAIAFDVPLPQLDARSPRALRDAIRSGLAGDEVVVLLTTDGEEFDLMPGSVREIGAATCRVD